MNKVLGSRKTLLETDKNYRQCLCINYRYLYFNAMALTTAYKEFINVANRIPFAKIDKIHHKTGKRQMPPRQVCLEKCHSDTDPMHSDRGYRFALYQNLSGWQFFQGGNCPDGIYPSWVYLDGNFRMTLVPMASVQNAYVPKPSSVILQF